MGPQAGRKVFTLQTLPAYDLEEPFGGAAGQVTGFSLHAGVAARANEREKLERLCRYIAYMEVGKGREQGAEALPYMEVGYLDALGQLRLQSTGDLGEAAFVNDKRQYSL